MKYLFTTLFLFYYIISYSQGVVNCNSHRYDQEVFSLVNITNDILYGSNTDANGAQVSLTLDVYEPAGDTLAMRPLIIWAHGGSFISGTKNDNDVVTLSQHFALRGYVCASINYRLGIPFPMNETNAQKAVFRAVQDMRAAVRFFRKDAAGPNVYKIDPSLIFCGGSSAGAFTALHLAYLDDTSEIPSQIDTTQMGGLEGNSGNPGFASTTNAVLNLCGALGNKTWMHPGDVPLLSMHGTQDQVVPYATDTIYLLGVFPVMVVDGSYSINEYANLIGVPNEMYTFYGAGHVPYAGNIQYMDTTIRFVSNFLYRYLGCTPSDPEPYPNTFGTASSDQAIHMNEEAVLLVNPARQYLEIRTAGLSGTIHWLVFDITGKKAAEGIMAENTGRLKTDISRLPAGLYLVRLLTQTRVITLKFLHTSGY
ncbi:MAG: carboxylesterase family protein [Bacteroidia bacterium]|nr:carboxylesterase family protein [Bacteroidia bacterium]